MSEPTPPPAPASLAAATHSHSADLVLFAIPSVVWGTTWLAIKFQLGTVAPELSVGWRFAAAAVLVLAWCGVRGISLRFALADHARLALLGVLLFGVNYVLVYQSEQHLTSGLVAVLFALLVFMNLLGARLVFGARAPQAVVVGAVLGVGGVALLFWPEVRSIRAGGGQWLGIAEAVAATALASGGNLLSQRIFSRGIAVVPGTGLAMGYAALLVIAFCALVGIPFTFDARPAYVLSLAYLALFGSVVAFVSFLTLVKRIGAGRAGYISVVMPVVAMLASTLFEGYRWTPAAVSGMALVLAGTALVLRARSRTA